MATELEQTLEIDDFFGIDRQVLREDINPKGFRTLQNVYERQLSEVQKIGGSTLLQGTFPSNVTGLDRGFRLYDRDFTKYRLVGIKCTPGVANTILPNATIDGITVQYVNVNSGSWNKLNAGVYTGTADANSDPGTGGVILQFIGYGVNIVAVYYQIQGPANSTLQIIIPPGLNSNITGVNIFTTTVVDAKTVGLGYDIYSPIWAGYIDLVTTNNGTYNFSQAPRFIPGQTTNPLGWPGASFDFGGTTPSFDLSGTTGGTLIPEKKYWVAVFTQRLKSNNDTLVTNTSGNDAARWERIAGEPLPIVLEPGQTAINIDNIAGTSACYAIAIGTDPELLTMQFITNTINNTLLDYHSSPNIVGKLNGAGSNDYQFLAPDYSLHDNLINVEDNGTFRPIFVSRISDLNIEGWTIPSSSAAGNDGLRLPFIQKQRFYSMLTLNGVNGTITADDISIGNGAKFRFTQYQSLAFFVNDAVTTSATSQSGVGYSGILTARNQAGYYHTDGMAAGSIGFAYGTSQVPKSKFIATYQESIVLGGGSKGSESYSTFYFSNALDPYNFAQGGTGTLLDFITVDPNGEPINNISLYTFSTGTDSPTSQLLITKPTSSWALSNLPVDFVDRTIMTNLSKRIGQAGDTIVVSPVGTIWASKENVYIVNPNGEPTPIGDSIESILRSSNLDNAVACYHDNHYKLCFRTALGSGPNDTQLWLDIRKMKASKGVPFWFGPHIGRNISYTWPEFKNDDIDKRYVVDQSAKTIYRTDIVDQNLHLGANIEAVIETPDYKAEPASLTNKLMNRFYWKAKVMRSTTFTDTTVVTSDAGETTETQTLTIAPPSNALWSQASFDYNLFVNAWHKIYPFFYQSRLVGRTFRKRLVHSGADNVSISGFALNFKIEKRRL